MQQNDRPSEPMFFDGTKCYRCGAKEHLGNNRPHAKNRCAKCPHKRHLAEVCQREYLLAQAASSSTPGQACSRCGHKNHFAMECLSRRLRCAKCRRSGHAKELCEYRPPPADAEDGRLPRLVTNGLSLFWKDPLRTSTPEGASGLHGETPSYRGQDSQPESPEEDAPARREKQTRTRSQGTEMDSQNAPRGSTS